jgi:hypothetical protein
MSNDVNVNVKVTSDMAKANADAKTLHKSLKGAADAATATSKAVSGIKPASQTKAYASAAKGATTPEENLNYGIARSISTGTGAAGRDFAKQAQGLGGLVHVYATFAANLFAVGAAFTALKNAADTSNMIKGLDQLGAASGRNLGGLSKEIVKLTDGAVSLREAMESVGKATSAGMSDENLKRMAAGAKNVSQALGVAMPDALSRLSRGISKIEPELLDELGIFVRVDKAAQDYARSIGKSVTSLTEFERRTSFAIATLDQLDKKFGKIKMEANPYDKLLAGLKDLGQTALETINGPLGVLVGMLAASPTGLAVAMATITGVLLKQAIPALGSVRDSMAAAAEQARSVANIKARDARASMPFKEKEALLDLENKIEDKIADVYKAENNLKKLRSQDSTKELKKSAAAFKLLAAAETDITKIDEKLFDNVERKAKKLDKAADAAKALGDTNQALSLKEEAMYQRAAAAAVKANQQAELDFASEEKRKTAIYETMSKGQSTVAQNMRLAEAANQSFVTKAIASDAAYVGSTQGATAAIKKAWASVQQARQNTFKIEVPVLDDTGSQLMENGKAVTKLETITNKGMGNIRAAWTMTTASIGAFTGALGTAMNALGIWAVAIGAVVAGLQMFATWVSNTTEESKATTEALEQLNSSTKNLANTIKYVNELPVLEQFSTEAIQAKATAVNGLADSMVSAVKGAFAEIDKMNGWDKFFNHFWDMLDRGVEDKLAESLASGFKKALEGLDSKDAEVLGEKLSKSLGVSNVLTISMSELQEVVEKLSKNDFGRAGLKQAVAESKAYTQALAVSAAKGTELKQATEQMSKTMKTFANSFIPSDSFSKTGADIMVASEKMSIAINEGPVKALNAMSDAVASGDILAMFPPEVASRLAVMTPEITKLNEEYKETEHFIDGNSKAIDAYTEKVKALKESLGSSPNVYKTYEQIVLLNNAIATMKEGTAEKIELRAELGVKVETYKELFSSELKNSFEYGAGIISSRLEEQWSKVGTAVGNVVAGLLGNTKEGIAQKAEMDMQILEGQRRSIQSQQDLIRSIYTSSQIAAKQTIVTELNTIALTRMSGAYTQKDIDRENALVADREKIDRGIAETSTMGRGSFKKIAGLHSEGLVDKASVELAKQLESSFASSAALADQMSAVTLDRIVKEVRAEVEKEEKIAQGKAKTAQQALDIFNINKQSGELQSKENILAGQALEAAVLASKHEIENLNTKKYILGMEKAIDATTGIKQTRLKTVLASYKAIEKVQLEEAQGAENTNKRLKDRNEILDKTLELDKKSVENKTKESLLELDKKKVGLGIEEVQLARLKESGIMSQRTTALFEFDLKERSLDLEREQDLVSIDAARTIKKMEIDTLVQKQRGIQEELKAKANLLKEGDPKKQQLIDSATAAGTQADSFQTSGNTALAELDSQAARQASMHIARKEALQTEKEIANEYAKQQDALSRMTSSAEVLANVFGEAGTAFGNFSLSLMDTMQKQQAGYATIAELQDKNKTIDVERLAITQAMADIPHGDTDQDTKYIENKETLAKLDKQTLANTEKMGSIRKDLDEKAITGTMRSLSANKKMFKEKTVAFKAISAMEKAQSLFNAAMMVKEMVLMGQKTIAAVTSSTTIAAAKTGETVAGAASSIASAGSGDPYTGIARVVAMIALMGVALAMVGKSAPKGEGGSFTPSSAQKQAISGSGMSYNEEGKLVENGGGVFGDASAQSETVAKSIEILKENSIDGLQYDNKMLKALERMANSLDSAAKGIYNIPGLRQGKAITAIPESTEGYGQAFYGKVSHAAAWGKLAEVTGDPIAGFLSNLGNTILNGVFGGKQSVSTKLVAAGVQLRGTILDLSNGADEAIRAYNDIKVTTKTDGGWFGKDKTSVKNKRVTQSIEEDTREAIADVFTQTRELFNLLGKEVGYTSTQVDESLATINASADIDVKGLSGSQILEQINYVTSGIIDNAASVVFESLAQFREFGEAMGETAVRVVRDTQLVKQSLKNIGMEDLIKSITDSGLEESQIKLRAIEISEGLIDMAGGLDTFLEHVETYRENFLTDTERLAPIKKNVSDVMSELATEYPEIGIATVNTRHEFKQLVSALDVTTVKGMALFTSLMDVAEGFDQVMDASDELASKVKLAGADFASLMTEAIMGKSTVEDIGKKVSASIQEGILQAISSAYIESISTAISEQLIMPLIVSISDSAISGAAVTAVITQSTIDNIITMATNAATAIEVIFGNADFQATLATISTTITTAMTAMRRPAVDAAADLSKFGLAASNFASVLKDGILGNISSADIGEKIATIIEEGILNALTTSAIDSITSIITQQIITPIITSITTGATISATISQASLNAVVDTAVAASRTLAAVFANEEFVETIKTISTVTGETFAQMSGAAQITSGSITKVLDKLGDANTRMINAYKAQTTALESARQKFASFASSLREFAASLRLSELSPLTPAQKYAQAREEFDRTATLAQAGDETALGKLQEVSRTFLDISRSFYASSAPYTSDFDRVQTVLDSSASAAEAVVTDIDVQIGIAREQLTALGDISTDTDNILTEIQKANLALEEAKKAATTTVADTLVTSFTMLDKNIDGLLTTDELGALGLATDGELSNIFKTLDTDNNGSISLLESLNSASRDVSIAVRSLNPLLTDIRTGNRSIEEYTAYLESINSSLTASGRDSLGNTDIISRYADMFSRAPDQAGLDYWSQSMANGTATPDNITQHMFTSGEVASPGASGAWLTRYIQQGYSEILGRPAEPAGLEYWKQQATSGRVALSDLYKTIAYAGASDTSRPEAASALDWLNRNPNYIGRFAAGGTHASGARIVGEQGPELEVTGPARLWSATQTRNMLRPAPVESSLDAELLAEIRKLNAKIDSLERTVATGDMINADATERNTKVVSNSVKDSTTTSIHASRMQKKAAIS